ncbi:hypothetical protein L6452_38539 [Arctium lappa]|uniref:Uncharacterized protein n=1 Tax=Arctium lappa TaxID=4217 RepID=A0ACB8XQK3_ARCLA|nr:hypothetical protein L6452_38539 [Arctium lappa]
MKPKSISRWNFKEIEKTGPNLLQFDAAKNMKQKSISRWICREIDKTDIDPGFEFVLYIPWPTTHLAISTVSKP